jgi:predicted RNA-binding protein with PUA-like domain
MAKWLLKSEPGTYSWDDLVRDGKTVWDGVRNHTAAQNLKAMAAGDEAFFYHSGEGKEVVAIARIVTPAFKDASDPTGVFVAVEIAPVRAVKAPVTLAQIKAEPSLKDMDLVRLSRLSVSKVTDEQWAKVLRMAGE